MPANYPLDLTGLSPGNKILDEVHVLTEVNAATYRIVIPVCAPFYLDNFVLKHVDGTGVETVLQPDMDYYFCLPYMGASRSVGKMIYGAVTINTQLLDGLLKVTYQTLGGEWVADPEYVRTRIAEMVYNPRTTVWDVVTNKPNQFPPGQHQQDFDTVYGQRELVEAVNALAAQIANGTNPNVPIIRHLVDLQNPHQVDKTQVGLGNVSNFPVASDQEVIDQAHVEKYVTLRQLLEFPLSDPDSVPALQAALASHLADHTDPHPVLREAIETHAGDVNNPHQVTKEQVGLGNVSNFPVASPDDLISQSPPAVYVLLSQVRQLLADYQPSNGGGSSTPTWAPRLTAASYYLMRS